MIEKRFYDAFAGIGGFRLGLERHGWKCVGGCEWDKYARSIYKRNFSEFPHDMDIREVKPEELPDIDCLCGGFPCPTFSLAGRRLGFKDPRGELFFELARIADKKRPRLLFFENVKGLLSHDRGRTFAVILATLDELGYDAEWQVLNSKDYVPQNRERVFIIGHLRGERTRQVFPLGHSDKVNEGSRGKTRQKGTRFSSTYSGAIDAHYYKAGQGTRTLIKTGNIAKTGHDSLWGRVYDPAGVAATLNAKGGGLGAKTGLYMIGHTKANIKKRYQKRDNTWTLDTTGGKMAVEDDQRLRRLTPTECERLQGFPDGWTKYGHDGKEISDQQRYSCLGNAVTVPVIEAIARRLT